MSANPIAAPAAQSSVVGSSVVGVPPSSLYVGDLHPDVTEAILFEKFSTVGTILSIRVCRDAITRSSLGYAYVNFQQRSDAERALETMNFDTLMGKSMRIMWTQRDPSIRRSGSGNIFIKNLSKHIDTKSIYDTFSMFGNILSCKVANDLEGNSKGYGFIHFETEVAAQKAIEKVNGMLLEGKTVFVAKFLPRAARLREFGELSHRFNIVYVKNFEDKLDKDSLEKLFAKCGTITSCVVMLNEENKSRGFGFVCFEKPEDAAKAVEDFNDYELPGTALKLTVCRAQKKSERMAELKRHYEQKKMERMQRYHGVNLYVKNLDESVTDEVLEKLFSGFGTITSAKVMRDENQCSKGFGFVCFEKPEDATKAVVEMGDKMIGTKPLYVALAQRKEDRKALLATQYMQRLASIRQQSTSGIPGAVYAPSTSGYFVPTMQNQRQGGYVQMANMYPSSHMRGSTFRLQGPVQSTYPQHYSRNMRVTNGQGRRTNQAGGNFRGVSGQPMKVGILTGGNVAHVHGHEDTARSVASAAEMKERQRLIDELCKNIRNICGILDADMHKLQPMLRDIGMQDIMSMLGDSTLMQTKVQEALSVFPGGKESSI